MAEEINKEELVSVIVPTYNRGYILSRAINSVLNQIYQNLEIIIVDDGSTDNTEQIVSGFVDTRIRYIAHAQNRGLSASRNTGIKNSRGDFIAFLDSDDEYLPDKINKSLEAFRMLSDRFGMVASNYYKIFLNGDKVVGLNVKKIKGDFPHVSGWLMRRNVFEKVGFFDERILLSEDVDYFYNFRKQFAFHTLKEPLVTVHESADSAFADVNKALELRKNDLLKLSGNRYLHARHLKYLGKDLLLYNRIEEATRCFLKAFFIYPHPGYFLRYLSCLIREKSRERSIK